MASFTWPAALLAFGAPLLIAAEHIAAGLTADGLAIEGLSVAATSPSLPVVLLIGGLGDGSTSAGIAAEVQRFENSAKSRGRFHLLVIPSANPKRAQLVFPPAGAAYKDNTESHYLWRWIATHAPDLVLVADSDDSGLAQALSQNAVAGIGRIPARRVNVEPGMLDSLPRDIPKSEARREIERRIARSPRQVATELAQYYGHDFDQPVYIPAIALIGRLRLGHLTDVERLAAPYLDGSKDSLAKATSSHLAGHLVFAELAERTSDGARDRGKAAQYIQLVRKAADLAFTETGEMREAMPLHNEMSDAVFMACPILASAGRLTGDRKYFDMAARHLSYMQRLCLRPDGLYRHSPLDDAAWGRGNAFPALGLALTLSQFPKDHAAYGGMLRSFQDHMTTLARFQDEDGMWRQVVDVRGAYSEFSATAMIATAMLQGIRSGWLPREPYQASVDRAWRAISARTGSDGRLIDVCESTGKQKSLDDYLRRTAILDRDPRGGGMALLFATSYGNVE